MALVMNPGGMEEWIGNFERKVSDIQRTAESFDRETKKIAGEWEGDAAVKNVESLQEAHNAVADFMNSLSDGYKQFITSVKATFADLETTNLGTAALADAIGAVDLVKVALSSASDPNSSRIKYNYDQLTTIGNKLTELAGEFESNISDLEKLAGEIGVEDNWAGNAADKAKAALVASISEPKPKLMESLKICSENITKAAENASSVDNG